jgi:hypothetical protein
MPLKMYLEKRQHAGDGHSASAGVFVSSFFEDDFRLFFQ